ncbi:hypothetical protein [Streptomyces sp. x-80]|uniref:hypothetical protein n=1 Tax=Streptomyces sp. x-80 TaxID=2789282 RepID=UPI003980C07C
MAADVEHQLPPDMSGLQPAEPLAETAAHLSRAVIHYAQALAPLITLTTGPQDTLQQQLDSQDHHSRLRLRVHLDGASRALAAARTALEAPQPPAVPNAPAPAPAHAPAARRRT